MEPTETFTRSGAVSLPALWQSIDALASQRLDALLSMEAGAMGVSKDLRMRDSYFASLSSQNGV
ncbi:MAG TPA: hypothetical protein VE999_06900 [Gemmataceae bacterium]|nr:hypothetical protein [Gemmataceae bacterium]